MVSSSAASFRESSIADTSPALVGFNVFWGILLAELSLDPEVQDWISDHPYTRSISSASLIILGLYFCSYPEENSSWSSWSRDLDKLAGYIFPKDVEYSRYYPGLGVDVLTAGVMFNDTAKKVLSHSSLLWMGKVSFAIYLLHAPLIRTVLTWVLFGFSVQPDRGKDNEGNQLPLDWLPIANRWICTFAIPLFYIFLYRVAEVWSRYVDPWCAKTTQWFEDLVFRDDAKQQKPILIS